MSQGKGHDGECVVEVRIGDGEVVAYAYEVFEQRVTDGRVPPDALVRFEPVTGDTFVEARELEVYQSIAEGAAVAWRERFRNSGPPILTALLVGLQVRIWWWVQLEAVGETVVPATVNWLSPALENGEPWRVLTYGLLHTDFLHILLNMVWMTYTGWNIERALGRANLALIFFLSVYVGGMLSMFLTPGVPSLGASGGVYGLVSASVVFGFVRQDLLPERGRRLFGAALAPYLVLMFLSGLSNPGTDNWAHFGGLITGGLLAFVLDPPGFERTARRNTWLQVGGASWMAVSLLVMGLFGPSIYPLVDREQARLDALPAASRERALQRTGLLLTDLGWSVPAGWKPGGTAAGDSGFVSPVRGQHRAYAVVLRDMETPGTPQDLLDTWLSRARKGHPDLDLEEGETTWLGRPARTARVTLQDGRRLEWVGTTRGVYGLYEVVECEGERWDRLETLFARMRQTVVWFEPLELQAARRDLLATPRGVKARTALASALARWGELDEASAMHEALVEQRPDDPSRWVAWLEMLAWQPRTVSVDPVLRRALEALPEPDVVVAVAEVLASRGDQEAAVGLLQLAWVHLPGDRTLKRALRRHGQRWVLDGSGTPIQVALLPDGSARDPDAIEALRLRSLDLAAAREHGRRVAQERARLAETFRETPTIEQLLWIRDGGWVFDDHRALRRELKKAQKGQPPVWMEQPLIDLLTPERLESLIAELTPKDAPTSP